MGRLGGAVRSFAVIRFCAASCILCYYLPLNWLEVIGTSEGNLLDYLRPGRVGYEGRVCELELAGGG